MMKDQDRTPVAKDVVTMCTKCKMELKHVVIAQDIGGFVKRVKCYTCGSEHNYRRAKKEQTPVAKRVVKKASARKVDHGKDFQAIVDRLSDKTPLSYMMTESYEIDDVIEHVVFGKGVVMNTSFQKMEVLFADGPRVLAMDKK